QRSSKANNPNRERLDALSEVLSGGIHADRTCTRRSDQKQAEFFASSRFCCSCYNLLRDGAFQILKSSNPQILKLRISIERNPSKQIEVREHLARSENHRRQWIFRELHRQ